MFGSNHYVPILRSKMAERLALRTSLIYLDPAPNETNSGHRGRVELSGDELARFLPSVRSHWLVSARQL
jgi:hypothetical protein